MPELRRLTARRARPRRLPFVSGLLAALACCTVALPWQRDVPQGLYRLALPGRDWALDVTLPELRGGIDSVREDGLERTLMGVTGAGKGKLMLSVRLIRAELDGDAKGFRDYKLKNLKKAGVGDDRVKLSEHKGIPVAAYEVPSAMALLGANPVPTVAAMTGGLKLMEAYLTKDDVWVLISVGAQSLGPEVRAAFGSVLDSLKFTDTSAPASAFDHFEKGRAFYLGREYGLALDHYRRAFELERGGPKLEGERWRLLVEEYLAILWSAGDPRGAKEVLEYGLGRDPSSGRMHYSLAQVYAALGDLDNALASLERAFINKKNIAPASKLPDPKKDTAFERFWEDERFKAAVKRLKR